MCTSTRIRSPHTSGAGKSSAAVVGCVWEEQGPGIENISLFANLQRTTSLERRSTSAGLQTPLLSGALSSGGWPGNTAGHAPEAPRFAPGYS